MLIYMLDTNLCIYVVKNYPLDLRESSSIRWSSVRSRLDDQAGASTDRKQASFICRGHTKVSRPFQMVLSWLA
jgi:hypothetical protein